jgi:ABC-type phosphate transport system ATPase subunit
VTEGRHAVPAAESIPMSIMDNVTAAERGAQAGNRPVMKAVAEQCLTGAAFGGAVRVS